MLLVIVFSAFSFIAGMLGLITAIRLSGKIYMGIDVSPGKPILISCLTGVSVTLIGMSFLLAVGEFNPDLRWPSHWSFVAVGVSLIAGFTILISTMWRFYWAGVFRKTVIKKIIDTSGSTPIKPDKE